MSFTSVDSGFSDRRYSFDGPDFGSLQEMEFLEAMGIQDGIDDFLDSVDREDDEPELEEDEEDEEEDDDTDSEKAWVSSPGIRF
jgi:hypothetical protein